MKLYFFLFRATLCSVGTAISDSPRRVETTLSDAWILTMAVTLHPLARTTQLTRAKQKAKDYNHNLCNHAVARQNETSELIAHMWGERDSTAVRSHRTQKQSCALTAEREAMASGRPQVIRRPLRVPRNDVPVMVGEFLNSVASHWRLVCSVKRHGLNTQSVQNKDAPIAMKIVNDYAPGSLYVDNQYLAQIADDTAGRYLLVGIDRASHWIYPRMAPGHPVYGDQREVSSIVLRRINNTAPMKIEKLLTKYGSQFTDRFITGGCFASKTKVLYGKHASDYEYPLLTIEHRLIKPCHRQTKKMVERFNGRVSDIIATKYFRSRVDL